MIKHKSWKIFESPERDTNRVAPIAKKRTRHHNIARVSILAIVAMQLIRSINQWDDVDNFTRSYWGVNYSYGFVRRGLGGELLSTVCNPPISINCVDAAVLSASILPLICLVTLVMLLLAFNSPPSILLAAAISSSPFGMTYFASQNRPEQFGLIVLFILGCLVTILRSVPIWTCGILGLCFAFSALIHESVALIYTPVAVLLVSVTASSARRQLSSMLAVGTPSILAITSQVFFGSIDQSQVERFTMTVPLQIRADFRGDFSDFLQADSGDSMGLVLALGWTRIAVMLVVIFSLSVPIFAALHAYKECAVLRRAWGDERIVASRMALIGLILSISALFTTGADWFRWVAQLQTVWLVCCALRILRNPANRTSNESSIKILPLILALAFIPPLPPLFLGPESFRLGLL